MSVRLLKGVCLYVPRCFLSVQVCLSMQSCMSVHGCLSVCAMVPVVLCMFMCAMESFCMCKGVRFSLQLGLSVFGRVSVCLWQGVWLSAQGASVCLCKGVCRSVQVCLRFCARCVPT